MRESCSMQNHEMWIKLAQEDLGAAKSLVKDGFHSSAMFHCQQSAEKALKGYLVSKKQPIKKTHNLVTLIELCMKIDTDFQYVLEQAGRLNPFSTRFRYPTEWEIPEESEALESISKAKDILKFTKKKILNKQLTIKEFMYFTKKEKNSL